MKGSYLVGAGALVLLFSVNLGLSAVRVYDEKRLAELREETLSMFYHGYNHYIEHAYPYDELRPLSCDGVDTWGSYSLTLIDTLDTLAIVGNFSEFRRVAGLIIENARFDMNINVSVFETNIRIVGGLLSAHLFSLKAGLDVEPGWPCQGPLLRLAEVVARKLLPAFDTDTGMPYGTVNLRYGVPPNETPVTCTAGVGTFIVEFGALSRLTGDPVYERVALRALHSLYAKRSALDLVGNHIDTKTGKWTAIDAGIGAGVDSFYEYLVKGAILFQRPELMRMFRVFHAAIEKHLGKGGWYVWATMGQGHVSATTFQSLETFFPGMLSLVGDFKTGLKAMTNYHRILKQYGGLPELYNIMQGKATHQREGYPLRPELVESAMYLYRATGDPYMLEIGEDILHSIQFNAKTECGYATIRDVTTLTLEDRMESFFLAETVKYLYLLFDPENFIHSEGEDATVVRTPHGKCTVYTGGYIFNTEAHPVDPSALQCCTGVRESELHKEIELIDEFRTQPKVNRRSSAKRQRPRHSDLELDLPQDRPSENSQGEVKKVEGEFGEEDVHFRNLHEKEQQGPALRLLSNNKSQRVNPLLEYGKKKKLRQFIIPQHEASLNISLPFTHTVTSESENLVFKLLKKLIEEQSEYKDIVNGFGNGFELGYQVAQEEKEKKGSKGKDLHKLVQSFEEKLKAIEGAVNSQSQAQKIEGQSLKIESAPTIENSVENSNAQRIESRPGQSGPDLDTLFGTGSRSLSLYFTLKWLPAFPDFIRHLIPSESFDVQKFYSKLNSEFSTDGLVKAFNVNRNWVDDHAALRCPTPKMTDRFMFFRSSLDD